MKSFEQLLVEQIVEEKKGQNSIIDKLRKIVKEHQATSIRFKDKKSAMVDVQTANVLVKVFDAVNDKNKKRFLDKMLSKAGFLQMVDFAWKQAK